MWESFGPIEHVYSPVSFFLTLAMDNVEFAPFSIRSVFTLHNENQREWETLTTIYFAMEKLVCAKSETIRYETEKILNRNLIYRDDDDVAWSFQLFKLALISRQLFFVSVHYVLCLLQQSFGELQFVGVSVCKKSISILIEKHFIVSTTFSPSHSAFSRLSFAFVVYDVHMRRIHFHY